MHARAAAEDANAPELDDSVAKLLPIPAGVEAELAGHLPSYMVPTAFFSVPEFPMNPSGNVDRRRLRDMGGSLSVERLAQVRTAARGPKRQPTSTAGQCLRRIWARALGIGAARIGLDDSFFHLGDSIAAMKVMAEARNAGIGLAVADVFRHPRLEDLVSRTCHVSADAEE